MHRFVLIAAIVAAMGGCILQRDSTVVNEHTHWYGTVTGVSLCQQFASKHDYRYECSVALSDDNEYRFNLKAFPGGTIAVGDRIGYTHKEFRDGRGYDVYLRRNDRLESKISRGICRRWMYFCWAEYKEQHSK